MTARKNAHAVALGRRGGKVGGPARAAKLTRDYAAGAMEVLSETYSAEHVNAVKRAVRKTWRAASFCMSRVDDGTPFGREYHMAINDLTGEQRLFRTRDEADKFVNEKNA